MIEFRSEVKVRYQKVIVTERVFHYSSQERKDFDEVSIANAEEIYLFGRWILLSELQTKYKLVEQ